MNKTEGNRRAALFFFEGYLSTQPSVLSAIERLRADGFDVDVFHASPAFRATPYRAPAGVELFECHPLSRRLTVPLYKTLGHIRRKLRNRRGKNSVRPFAQGAAQSRFRNWVEAIIFAAELCQFGLFCRRRFRGADFAIAFDATGLAAMAMTVSDEAPFIYWSLELLMLEESEDFVRRFLKKLEMHRLPQARAIAVQSRERAALLSRGDTLSQDRIAIVPNSPSGPISRHLRRDYFNSRFNIPPAKLIVLHAGMINWIVRSAEIAAATPAWPDTFVLVFHAYDKRDPQEPYLQTVLQAGQGRVVLSLDPVPSDRVDEIYAGAAIGLVCYSAIDANWSTSFSSSGKLAYYLRHGVPVIVVADQTFELVSDYGFGLCVNDTAKIGDALKTIAADYVLFSDRAKKCYAELFDFGGAFHTLIAVAKI